ncbi:hypothetical protein [Streptomyces triticisoli]|uniref:hypothetical protein n=1 Tax=Streptomyces triticisoli TaxID=2182797 RepID=UPI000DDBD925|nr:hypothetical protein [Streptomyces triticisoli]
MGIDEAVARSNASRLLEQALDDGALVPGARGYAAARIKRLERWLTPPHPAHDGRTPLDAVHSERRRTWAEAPPAARRRLRGTVTDLLSVAPEAPADTAEPLRWLLESVGDGVTLTQAGHLPRALVIEAAERYDWYLPGMVPRTEYDVVRLAELHGLARAARRLAKRHRKLALTARGRQHLADPALLQATAAHVWFGDGVRADLAEAAAAALLDGELTLDDLTAAVHTLAVEAFTPPTAAPHGPTTPATSCGSGCVPARPWVSWRTATAAAPPSPSPPPAEPPPSPRSEHVPTPRGPRPGREPSIQGRAGRSRVSAAWCGRPGDRREPP